MQTPEQCWQDYRRRVLPSDAGPVQLAETKRSFMAGMMALDDLLDHIALLPDGDDAIALRTLRQELLNVALAYVTEGTRGPTN